jgi:hypothetical protein
VPKPPVTSDDIALLALYNKRIKAINQRYLVLVFGFAFTVIAILSLFLREQTDRASTHKVTQTAIASNQSQIKMLACTFVTNYPSSASPVIAALRTKYNCPPFKAPKSPTISPTSLPPGVMSSLPPSLIFLLNQPNTTETIPAATPAVSKKPTVKASTTPRTVKTTAKPVASASPSKICVTASLGILSPAPVCLP